MNPRKWLQGKWLARSHGRRGLGECIHSNALNRIDKQGRPAVRTVVTGGVVLGIQFLLGTVVLIRLNATKPANQFRDVGLLFGATIAATGAITAAFIAFQASRHIEAERDSRERRRMMDVERTKTEAAIGHRHFHWWNS